MTCRERIAFIILVIVSMLISVGLLFHFNCYLSEPQIIEGEIVVKTGYASLVFHLAVTLLFIIGLFLIRRWLIANVFLIINYFKRKLYNFVKQALPHSLKKVAFFSKPKLWITGFGVFIVLILIALFQTYTLWDYQGEVADENALVYFAVGFFGGAFDPHWYGYGALGMYLLYGIYYLFSILMLFLGKFGSLDEYAMQLFYNGYFIQVGRYVFAIVGLIALYIFIKILREAKIAKPYWILFALVSILSIDAILFANKIRPEQLILLFALLMILSAIKSNDRKYLYLMAFAVSGAIASKITAMPFVLVLAGYALYRLYTKEAKWYDIAGVVAFLVISLYILQPQSNWFVKVINMIRIGIEGRGGGQAEDGFYWSRDYHYTITERLSALYTIFVKYCGKPTLITLPLLVFTRKYLKIVFPSILVLILLVVPYLGSPEIMYYWFLPAFPLIRFLSIIAIVGLFEWIEKFISSKNLAYGKIASYILKSALYLAVILFVLRPLFMNYLGQYQWKRTNKEMAEEWIMKNLAEKHVVLIDDNYQHMLPKIYDKSKMVNSKQMSRVFLYERENNQYLNYLFERYIQDYYYEMHGIGDVRGIEIAWMRSIINNEYMNSFKGKYFVTTPPAYNQFLKRKTSDLSEQRVKQLIINRHYYQYILSNSLVKRFDDGIGQPIEVYFINNEYSSPID